MPTFSAPMISLYSRDLSKAVAFYSVLGFVETFRTRSAASPSMSSSSWTGSLGIASIEAAQEHHSREPGREGRWIEVVLWTDDTDSAAKTLVATGPPLLTPAHDFLEGKLRAAWIADPDGNPIQLSAETLRGTAWSWGSTTIFFSLIDHGLFLTEVNSRG